MAFAAAVVQPCIPPSSRGTEPPVSRPHHQHHHLSLTKTGSRSSGTWAAHRRFHAQASLAQWDTIFLPDGAVKEPAFLSSYLGDGRSVAVEEPTLPCDSCKAKGWIICDFCNGQKTNVQVRSNRMYRRCPSCRAAGVLICPQCKVFKCVTFPDGKDGGFEM